MKPLFGGVCVCVLVLLDIKINKIKIIKSSNAFSSSSDSKREVVDVHKKSLAYYQLHTRALQIEKNSQTVSFPLSQSTAFYLAYFQFFFTR